jgi:hypothetical protein
MQFQVPQFIDVEDKIFGPLTLKQFLYLAGAGALSFILFFALQMPVWIGLTVFLFIFAAALAFIKYNGQSMVATLGFLLRYLWFPKFYLWHYAPPTSGLPVIHSLPRENSGEVSGGPLKRLLLKFNTAQGSTIRNS